MNIIPIIKKFLVILDWLYFRDVGNSSVRDICIIIPAIRENRSPNILSLIKGDKKRYVRRAPNGSDKADTKV